MANNNMSPSNEMQDTANSMVNGAKDVTSAAKAATKAATGNLAGAAKEVAKNPTGILKVAVSILAAILIPISLILSVLTNGIYGLFFAENSYSAVSNFVQMQTDFRKDCLNKSYSYLQEEIYKEVCSQMLKVSKQDGLDENFKKGIKEIFENKTSLSEFINQGYINMSNPPKIGKEYEDYADIKSGDARYFSILESESNGYEISYDKKSTAGQSLWDRNLQVIDFNNKDKKAEDSLTQDKALYTFQYKNAKFYENSESVSMYKSIFDSFFDATMTYANTKRLQQTDLLKKKGEEGYENSIAYLREQMTSFDAEQKKQNEKFDYEEVSDTNSPYKARIVNICNLADKLYNIYIGESTENEELYKSYPCQEYRDAIQTAFDALDNFLKSYNVEDEMIIYSNKIKQMPSVLPSDNLLKGKEKQTISSDDDDEEGLNLEVSDEDTEIDYDEDEAAELTKIEDAKMEAFIEFYKNPLFYENLFTYKVSVSDASVSDGQGERYSIKVPWKDENKEVIADINVDNIKLHKIINVSVETCSETTLYQSYAQYFYENFVLGDVDGKAWGELLNSAKDNNTIDETDYLKMLMLYFAGEEVDNTSDNYKDFVILNVPNLNEEEKLSEKSFDDKSMIDESSNTDENKLIVPSFTKKDDDGKVKSYNISESYFSDYLQFNTGDNNGMGYDISNPIGKNIKFNGAFSGSFVNLIKENEILEKNKKRKNRNISVIVAVDKFELKRNKQDEKTAYFVTEGSENASAINVSGTLTVNGTTQLKCGNVSLEENDGRAILNFVYDSGIEITSINSLSVSIKPSDDNAAIRNVKYYIGSVSDSYVNAMPLSKFYKAYLDAGIENSSILTDAGYVTANIYIQYKTDMFGVLFRSYEIEDTKRQFVTDVSNIAKKDDGNLLIRGTKDSDSPLCITPYDYVSTNIKGKYFYFVSCAPDSLIYMPEGMELCTWDGSQPKKNFRLLETVPYGDNIALARCTVDGGAKYLKGDNSSSFAATIEGEDVQPTNYNDILSKLDYQGSTKISNWVSFKDNLLQYTIICFQSAAMDKEGEYQILKGNHYANSTYGSWRNCEYWEKKSSTGSCKSAYEYFNNEAKNPPNGVDEDDYVPTVATEPVILGTVTQTNVLEDDSAIGEKYDFDNVETYPTFAIAVNSISATESIYGNFSKSEDLNSGNYSLNTVFDLDEVNNDAYVDNSTGYCWPLEDSYDASSVISASFNGTVLSIDNDVMTIEVSEINADYSSEVSVGDKITLKNVNPIVTQGSEFKAGNIIAQNLSESAYIDMQLGKSGSKTKPNAFSYFRLSTSIEVNPDQTKEDKSGNISNALALFDGKVVERDENNLIIYNDEDNLYCEYEGETFSSVSVNVGDHIPRGSIVGYVAYDSESNAVDGETGTAMESEYEILNNSFKVSVYSDSNYDGSADVKEDKVINNQADMIVKEIKDYTITCESVQKIKKYDKDGNLIEKIPAANYVFSNVKELNTIKVGSKILMGQIIGTIISDAHPSLKVTYSPGADLKYYKNLLDFFPGRKEFANKSKKIIASIESTGVEGDSVSGQIVTDSFPVYVGKTTVLTAKASPISYNFEKFKWEEIIESDDGKSLVTIETENNGHKIKITPKGNSLGRVKIQGTYVDDEGNTNGGQPLVIEAAIIKSPSKVNITYIDYYKNSEGKTVAKEASTLSTTNNMFINSDGEQLYVFNPKMLTSKFTKTDNGKYLINMFKADFSAMQFSKDAIGDIYNGEETVEWTLQSVNGASGLELEKPSVTINSETGAEENKNNTGNLLYDGKSVMTNENQYYILTARVINTSNSSNPNRELYSKSINIHIINPVTKISADTAAIEKVSGEGSGNRLYITPSTQKSGIKLNDYINWKVREGEGKGKNFFGPATRYKTANGTIDMVDVSFSNDYLEYKNGKICVSDDYLYNNKNPEKNSAWGKSTTVTVKLKDIAFKYSQLGEEGLSNAQFQFNVILDFNVKKILLTGAKKYTTAQYNIGLYKSASEETGMNDEGMHISYYTLFLMGQNTADLTFKLEDPDGEKIEGLAPSRLNSNKDEISDLNVEFTDKGCKISSSVPNLSEINSNELWLQYGENAKMQIEVVCIPVASISHIITPSSKIVDADENHSILSPGGTVTKYAKWSSTVNKDSKAEAFSFTLPIGVDRRGHSKGDKLDLWSDYCEVFSSLKISAISSESTISLLNAPMYTKYATQKEGNPGGSNSGGDSLLVQSFASKYMNQYIKCLKNNTAYNSRSNSLALEFSNLDGYDDYNFIYTSTLITEISAN